MDVKEMDIKKYLEKLHFFLKFLMNQRLESNRSLCTTQHF